MSRYNDMSYEDRRREERRQFENDVHYDVWRSGRDTDHIDYNRVEDNFHRGYTAEQAAREEIAAQRRAEERRREEREYERQLWSRRALRSDSTTELIPVGSHELFALCPTTSSTTTPKAG